MNIAGMRVRITIQKNETVVDKYGNHKSEWTNYFTCWASASKENTKADETEAAGHTEEEDRMNFTVRWSSETDVVNSKNYRIKFGRDIFKDLSRLEKSYKEKGGEEASAMEITTALFLLRCLEVGLSLSDLDLLTIGMVLDIWTEKGNDGEKYETKAVVREANQHDFDVF